MDRKHYDKMKLAMQSAPYMTREIMAGRFDWEEQMEQIVARIKCWNA